MTKIITRRKMFYGKKYYLTTNAIKSDYDGKWTNCLYLHFAKEDFPCIPSPKIIQLDNPLFVSMKRRFAYEDSILNQLDFHGGITFYEEMHSLESERTYVKVGCDYQHLYDDEYRLNDNGESLLEYDGARLAKQFDELVQRLSEARGEGQVWL